MSGNGSSVEDLNRAARVAARIDRLLTSPVAAEVYRRAHELPLPPDHELDVFVGMLEEIAERFDKLIEKRLAGNLEP